MSSILAQSGRPIRHAVLVRGGYLTDYDDSNQSQVPFAMVTTSNAALELMMGTKSYPKLAADIPPCITEIAATQI